MLRYNLTEKSSVGAPVRPILFYGHGDAFELNTKLKDESSNEEYLRHYCKDRGKTSPGLMKVNVEKISVIVLIKRIPEKVWQVLLPNARFKESDQSHSEIDEIKRRDQAEKSSRECEQETVELSLLLRNILHSLVFRICGEYFFQRRYDLHNPLALPQDHNHCIDSKRHETHARREVG